MIQENASSDGGKISVSAAILAGGKSRRMGSDKALLSIGGQTMLEAVSARVSAVAQDVFVVADDGAKYRELGLRVVEDAIPGAGSLGGVYAALLNARHEQCLVVACDMPLLNIELLRYLVQLAGRHDVVIPSLGAGRSDQGGDETLETMHAIYRTASLRSLERRIQAGDFKIAAALDDLVILRVREETIRRFDPHLHSFFNVNTPQDFAFAQSIVEERLDASPARE